MEIARIIPQHHYSDAPVVLLRHALDMLAEFDHERPLLVMTPGAFVNVEKPAGTWSHRRGYSAGELEHTKLAQMAEKEFRRLLTKPIRQLLSARVDYFTCGVDFWEQPRGLPFAELVLVYDVQGDAVLGVTGKSHPTTGAERHLALITDLNSHNFTFAGERITVLGCHDLNMWSPRGRASLRAGSDKARTIAAFDRIIAKFRPTVVLQHPHTADTPRIWRPAWAKLRAMVPSVTTWASAFVHDDPWRAAPRDTIDNVLDATASEGIIELVL